MPKKATPTTKAIGELLDLYDDGRLDLTPDYQRNSVWPNAAKSFLIDTVLRDLPIPLLFLSRSRDSNTGKLSYRVIDGQQRIRAAMSFRENRLSIPNQYGIQKVRGGLYDKVKHRHLPKDLADAFLGYSFVVMELAGYDEDELRDIFLRINKYVVRLNPQEMRDASGPGPFRSLVDNTASNDIWLKLNVFSNANVTRKRDKEFIAELLILLLEGPQDKKGSVDLYYEASPGQLSDADETMQQLLWFAKFIGQLFNFNLPSTFRKLPALYALIGALADTIEPQNSQIPTLLNGNLGNSLRNFSAIVETLPPLRDDEINDEDESTRLAVIFQRSVSQQTDNVKPRMARIGVIRSIISASLE